MSKKKKRFNEPKINTFEEALALIFGELVPKKAAAPVADEEFDPRYYADQRSFIEDARREVFDMMLSHEMNAYELLHNFIRTPIDDDREFRERDSVAYLVDHASWNTQGFRDGIAEEISVYEARVAKYAYWRDYAPGSNDAYYFLSQVQDQIRVLVDVAREVELLTKLELIDYNVDKSRSDIEEYLNEREEIEDELDEIYSKCGCLNDPVESAEG